MQIFFHKDFKKDYARHAKIQGSAAKRLAIFAENEFDPILRNHPLQGRYLGYRSIDITGSCRAIYRLTAPDTAFFIALGTHAELYE